MTKFLEPPLAVQYAWGIRYFVSRLSWTPVEKPMRLELIFRLRLQLCPAVGRWLLMLFFSSLYRLSSVNFPLSCIPDIYSLGDNLPLYHVIFLLIARGVPRGTIRTTQYISQFLFLFSIKTKTKSCGLLLYLDLYDATLSYLYFRIANTFCLQNNLRDVLRSTLCRTFFSTFYFLSAC